MITDGRLQGKCQRQSKIIDFWFSMWCHRALFGCTHTYQSVCGHFQSLLLPPPGAHRPPYYLLHPLLRISAHLSYHFTLHLPQQSCDWTTLSASDPISSLFMDSGTLPLPSPRPLQISSLCLFTSLFHTSPLFTSPTDLPGIKKLTWHHRQKAR